MVISEVKFPSRLFISGIDTDAGKSYATGWLARSMMASGMNVITQKFVQTGNQEFSEDIEVHRALMGTGMLEEDLNHLTAPEIFSYPCSPDLAAKIDKRKIDLAKISDASDALAEKYDHLLIEGAGGLMVPLDGDYLTIDYIIEKQLPVILVTNGRLGSISHTLLAIDALKNRNIPLFAIIYNTHFDKDPVISADTKEYLQNWMKSHLPETLYIEIPTMKKPNMEDLKRTVSITKDELASLPVVDYNNGIVLVEDTDKIDEIAKTLSSQKIIGFDTETKPSFKRGQMNKVSLLQLSTHEECFLIRLNKVGLPESIKEILENPDILKIGLSIHDDFHSLNKICSLDPHGFIELQSFVKDFNIHDNSLARIYGILFGKRISKGQRLTNWEADELTIHQQGYAALDALACIEIYEHLLSGKFNPEDSEYYRIIEQQIPNQQVVILPAQELKSEAESEVKPKRKRAASKKKAASKKDVTPKKETKSTEENIAPKKRRRTTRKKTNKTETSDQGAE